MYNVHFLFFLFFNALILIVLCTGVEHLGSNNVQCTQYSDQVHQETVHKVYMRTVDLCFRVQFTNCICENQVTV